MQFAAWDEAVPEEARTALCNGNGYEYDDAGEITPAGLYASTRSRYDIHHRKFARGLVTTRRDAVGTKTSTHYGAAWLLPEVIRVGGRRLRDRSVFDLRTQQQLLHIDPNGNRTAWTFGPAGFPRSRAVLGREDLADGDREGEPSVTYEYGFEEKPVYVRTRMWTEPQRRGRVLETFDYSDGSGRLLQTRTRQHTKIVADLGLYSDATSPTEPLVLSDPDLSDTPEVRVHGWTTYDNKGRPVEQYEPFFDSGWEYARPAKERVEKLLKMRIFRDPTGAATRIVRADDKETRYVYGEPEPTAPIPAHPSAWELWEYDANDNEAVRDQGASAGFAFAPTSIRLDARGRVISITERAGEEATVRAEYDPGGNVRAIFDARGLLAYEAWYDLCGRPWRERRLDSGTSVAALDAAGGVLEERNDAGGLIITVFDPLHRVSRRWGRDSHYGPFKLRAVTVYGDDPAGPDDASTRRLIGTPWRIADEAGLVTIEQRDLHGLPTRLVRHWLTENALLAAACGAEPEWPTNAISAAINHPALDPAPFELDSRRDMLGRLVSQELPVRSDGRRPRMAVEFAEPGQLVKVGIVGTDSRSVIDEVAYDARMQRVAVKRASGIVTRFVRDRATGRLLRLHSTTSGDPAVILQDLSYEYDPVGSITAIEHRSPMPALAAARRQEFTYDPRHRLISSSGVLVAPHAGAPWCLPPAGTGVVEAREIYTYDIVGNLVVLERQDQSGTFERREFELSPGKNSVAAMRLSQRSQEPTAYEYSYDGTGNVAAEADRKFEWNWARRLKAAEANDRRCRYFHDADGVRVVKAVACADGELDVTFTVSDVAERRVRISADASAEVAEDVALVRDGDWVVGALRLPAGESETFTDMLVDHLGSITIRVDDTNVETVYTPYGEITRIGSATDDTRIAASYGFAGRYTHEETGVVDLGARELAPWTGRFLTPEPLEDARRTSIRLLGGQRVTLDPPSLRHPPLGTTPYAYALASPLSVADPDGRDAIAAAASPTSTTKEPPGAPPAQRQPDAGRPVHQATGDLDMRPDFVADVKEIAEKSGKDIYVRSGGRTREEQEKLYKEYQDGTRKTPVAKPGTSKHESLLAADLYVIDEKGNKIPARDDPDVSKALYEKGYKAPIKSEPWHFEKDAPKEPAKDRAKDPVKEPPKPPKAP
jgi:RHS repeat-associated protein